MRNVSENDSDDWRTYTASSENVLRCKRQCISGIITMWMMVLPTCLLSFFIIKGTFRSSDYIKLLKENILPIVMLNLRIDFFFKQDKSSVHQTRQVQSFLKASNVSTVLWPDKSPDINITEDAWKMIPDIVYDGPPFRNKENLVSSNTNAINHINSEQREKIKSLYTSITSRLCKVLKTSGNLYNA